MTGSEYRRLSRNFDRQSRADLPYAVDRVGIVPRIAAAWREYWAPEPVIVSRDADATARLLAFIVVGIPAVWIVGKCCGLWA